MKKNPRIRLLLDKKRSEDLESHKHSSWTQGKCNLLGLSLDQERD